MAAKAEQFATVWARPQRQRRDSPTLSREQIVSEAIALLDSEGYEALSMRRLGTRLNAGATSLYTHVANREELLELVVDQVFGEIRLPAEFTGETWREDLTGIARSVRATLLGHRWVSVVLSTAGLIYLGPNVMRLSEAMLGVLEAAGFGDDAADRASNAIIAYLLGSSSTEAAMLTTVARSGLTEQQWMEQIMGVSVEMSKPYPRLHKRYLAYLDIDSATARDNVFEQEIGLILDGLATQRS
ncbi:TetR/AcrR family transcriptional regulator [Nocardia inohanensis]|uniref:TetR/AcrR family transcriptional regulator n=1 Tax=Nocardia inohanensis TaxID=209246 RepID=UPI000829BCAF|nr:TetR/AcrR family transcriptional regulator [Nocardia inohanensis]